MGLGFWGLGFWDLGFRVCRFGVLGAWGLGVWGLGFRGSRALISEPKTLNLPKPHVRLHDSS